MNLRHLSLVVGLPLLALCAHAQTTAAAVPPEIEFYGLIDLSMRESNNANAAGQSKLELTDGVLTGSRLGLRGRHPVGDIAAVYTAEAGFSPDSGTSLQGGRLFGRQLYGGLDGDFGTLLGGRQYAVAYNTMTRYEAFGFANTSILGYESAPYLGLRYDNTVKYLKSVGPVQFQYAHTFGNVAGSINAGSADGVSVNYTDTQLTGGLTYQKAHNVSSAYFSAVPEALASTQDVWGGGLTYQAGPAKLYFGYVNSKLDVAQYKNSVYFVGTNYQATPALQIIASVAADKLDHAGAGGNRLTTGLMGDYFLDKRTDLYVEVDYTNVKGAWIPLANNTGLSSGDMYGFDNRTGFSLGGRIKF